VTTTQPQQPTFVGTTPPQSLTPFIEMWEPFVHQALEAQTAMFKSWGEALPEPFKTQILQMHESQRQMWDAMFGMLRQVTSASHSPAPTAMPGLDFWQKMAAPMFEAQAAWMRQSASLVNGPTSTQKGDVRK
jgi:hypothetical protein